MSRLQKFNILLAITLVFILTACNSSSSSSSGAPISQLPITNEQSVAKNGCFNVEVLQGFFGSQASAFPAFEITTDFNPDTKLGVIKSQFHTHAAFDIKDKLASDIFIFKQPVQTDCLTVKARTISGEELNFNIVNYTANSISLSLQKPSNPETSNYRKEGLEKKLQPIRYDIVILGNMHLRVTATYRSFDAHCRGKALVVSKIQKDYFWAVDHNGLPSEILLQELFYNNYLSTLKSEIPTQPIPEEPITPIEPPPGSQIPVGYISVNINELRILLEKKIKEELIKCNY